MCGCRGAADSMGMSEVEPTENPTENPTEKTFYNEDGTINRVYKYDENGVEILRIEYEYQDGYLSRQKEYIGDHLKRELGYLGSENPFFIFEYEDFEAEKFASQTWFHEDGTLSVYCEFVDGKRWKETGYFSNGDISEEREYLADGETIKYKKFYNVGGIPVSSFEIVGPGETVECEYQEGILKRVVRITTNPASYEMKEYDATGKLAYLKEGGEEYGWSSLTTYNADSQVVEKVSYIWAEFTNPKRGNVFYVATKTTNYDGEGNILSWEKTECDSDGNKIRTTTYDANDNVTRIVEYDENGNGHVIKG